MFRNFLGNLLIFYQEKLQVLSTMPPIDDGLPMRESGQWAKEKLDYLRRYMEVFSVSMQSKWAERNYIDLQAGPGVNQIKGTSDFFFGSPLVALNCSVPFTGYYFVEMDPMIANALRQRCNSHSLGNRADISEMDCNTASSTIASKLKRFHPNSLNLAFLDPEGFEMKWSAVRDLASVKRMDLVINYPQGGLNRAMPNCIDTVEGNAVDQFFGTTDWRDIFRRHPSGRAGLHSELIDLYRSGLNSLGYVDVQRDDQVGDEPLMRNARSNAPLYRLIFASKHSLGTSFWRKITKRDLHGQHSLFE